MQRLNSSKPFDDFQQTTASRTLSLLKFNAGCCGRRCWRWSSRQQAAAQGQEVAAFSSRQKAEETDTHETARHCVCQDTAQELVDIERHQLLLVAVCVILPVKGHLSIGQANQSMIGDGNTMGVAGQILEHVLRPTERRLAIDDPVFAK